VELRFDFRGGIHMKIASYFFISILLVLSGCSKENPVMSDRGSDTGSIILKIDKDNAPASVVIVNAILTRDGFNPVRSQMDLISDSTAELGMRNIPVGKWHLKVEAKNRAGDVEYMGETDVLIIQNTIIQVSLTLYPVTGGTGGIYIYVTWGEQNVWKESPLNPVLNTGNNPSNPTFVTMPKVIYDNGIYKMWYNALYTNAVSAIWYAESPDGKNWNTVGSQPVLTKGNPGAWDSYTIVISSVFKEDNLFKMYYVGCSTHPYYGPWSIGLAVSQDGKVWHKNSEPVITDHGIYNRLGLTAVVKKDNKYFGYFSYFNPEYSRTFIGVGESLDGITWNMYSQNPVLSANHEWEGNGLVGPTVVYEAGKFQMYYGTYYPKAIGYAESADGYIFSKNPNPLFTREQSFHHYDRISYLFYINVNNTKRLYFTAEQVDRHPTDGICFLYK
jgi:predicted GH43/DUF377 family glycosyl hydrolase